MKRRQRSANCALEWIITFQCDNIVLCVRDNVAYI